MQIAEHITKNAEVRGGKKIARRAFLSYDV
jgi:hypothetical protein